MHCERRLEHRLEHCYIGFIRHVHTILVPIRHALLVYSEFSLREALLDYLYKIGTDTNSRDEAPRLSGERRMVVV